MRVFLCLSLAVMCAVTGGIAQGAERQALLDQLAGKKLVAFGWDSPNTLFLRNNTGTFESSGYQGVVINPCHDPRLPNRVDTRRGEQWWRLCRDVFVPRPMRREDWQFVVDDLRECQFESLTDNFLLLHSAPGKVDFFDGDFDTAVENTKIFVSLAKAAGCKGIFFDVENYSGLSLFHYPKRRHARAKSFSEYQAKVRERGRQWMRAVCEEFPAVTLMFVWCHSSNVRYMGLGKSWAEAGYGLLPSFVDGCLEAKSPQSRIIDGFEFAYPFRTRANFLEAYHLVRQRARRFSSVPDLYDAHLEVGFGIWLDYGHRKFGWSSKDFSSNFHTPVTFEKAARAALEVSDEYVWVWAEKCTRWFGDNYPEAYRQATIRAGKPEPQGAFLAGLPHRQLLLQLPNRWRFKLDPNDEGQRAGYFRADFDDSAWEEIAIAKTWESQGFKYDGLAWHRVSFSVEKLPPGKKVYLQFGGVDESAWVYLNGKLVGDHDLGETGWNQPFWIDVTNTVKSGQNQVAVRVLDRVLAGGIWHTVWLVAEK